MKDKEPTRVLVYIDRDYCSYYSKEVHTLCLDEWDAMTVTGWAEQIRGEPLHHELDEEVPPFVHRWSYGPWSDDDTIIVLRF